MPRSAIRCIGFLTAAGCLAFLFLAASCRAKSPATEARAFEKGIAFTGYWSGAYDGDGPSQSLGNLKQTNATWISILVTGYQDTIASTSISYTGASTPTDASLETIIQKAHDLGLKVMLKPHVDLANDPAHYRGEIGPAFTAADWTAWFASYRTFVLHYAALAAGTRCEMFCVGCELGTTAVHADEWRSIVTEVRAAYSGPLTYADNQVESNPAAVAWWDAVDYIGQDAYPTLTQNVNPTVDDLVTGWAPFRQKLQQLAQKWGKSLILTEIGARSVAGGAQNPWDWQRQGPVDLTVQSNFYEAALRSVSGQSWMAGMYWWQWSPDPADGGTSDTGYTPHGKPAEAVLRSWYGKDM